MTDRPRSDKSASKIAPASTIKTVVTAPPWARDEPPSPTDSHLPPPPSPGGSRPPSEARRSDVFSLQSSAGLPPDSEHRWFPFTRRRQDTVSHPLPDDRPSSPVSSHRLEKIVTSLSDTRAPSIIAPRDNFASGDPPHASSSRMQDWRLHLAMPSPAPAPNTLAQSRTPGWDSPWAARPFEPRSKGEAYQELDNERPEGNFDNAASDLSRWKRFKKRARRYLLSNTYVPLLFRFINITFTTSALAVAIRIRILETRHHVTGALGSSPTLVVIFAPLTLVHVMVAIYLEYFGRPLGLWRTSAKLAHTLLEVLFICAWSAALSLCFDNFFTSLIPCALPSQISWYSELPRPPSPFGNIGGNGGPGDALCDDQLVLICLVAIGLLMYCFNLVISLYRIFEKVKVHNHSLWAASVTRV